MEGTNKLFPHEETLITQGLTLAEDLGDRRVYRGNGHLAITAENGFHAEYIPTGNTIGEVLAKSDSPRNRGFGRREGSLEELGYLVDLVKQVLEHLTPEEARGAYIKIFNDDGHNNAFKRYKMFDHFFKLLPGFNNLGESVYYIRKKE